jgi:hypothetical protein
VDDNSQPIILPFLRLLVLRVKDVDMSTAFVAFFALLFVQSTCLSVFNACQQSAFVARGAAYFPTTSSPQFFGHLCVFVFKSVIFVHPFISLFNFVVACGRGGYWHRYYTASRQVVERPVQDFKNWRWPSSSTRTTLENYEDFYSLPI